MLQIQPFDPVNTQVCLLTAFETATRENVPSLGNVCVNVVAESVLEVELVPIPLIADTL